MRQASEGLADSPNLAIIKGKEVKYTINIVDLQLYPHMEEVEKTILQVELLLQETMTLPPGIVRDIMEEEVTAGTMIAQIDVVTQ